jgi:branched-subunit amino acid transport protein AzlD
LWSASWIWATDNFWKTFAVMIQLGAILAILVIYFGGCGASPSACFPIRRHGASCIGVLLAFLPAAVIGLLFGSFIKSVLFNPWVVCFTLIAGGAVLLWVDQQDLRPRYHDAMILAADVSRHRHRAMRGDDSRRVAFGRVDRSGDAVRRGQARGGGILVLPCDPHHGRRVRLRLLQEPRRHDDGPPDW